MITFARYLLLLLALAVLPSAWTLTIGAQSRIAPAGSSTISGADGAIVDGDSAVEADVLDYANSNPLAVRLTDTDGNYVGAGAGTQYAVDAALGATPTGTLAIAIRDDALAALTPVEGDAIGLRVDANGALWTIHSGAIAATQSGTWDEVGINDSGNSITVDNAALAVVGGGVEATALRVTLASDSTGVVSVDDNGGALTIDGTVTVTDGAGALNVICDSGCSGGTQYAEDAIAGSGDTGTLALVVRQDAQSDLAADGDYIPLTVDGDGGLRVSIVAGAGSGGTAVADDADITAGTTSFTPMGGFYQSTVTACTDGDGCMAGLTTGRALKVALSNADGSLVTYQADVTLGTDTYTEATSTGPLVGAVRNDTLAALANTDNEIAPLQVDANGALYVKVSDTSLTVDLGANNDVTVTSGTVTANLSATDNAVLDDIADGITVDLGANNDVTVTGTVDLGATDNAVLDSIADGIDVTNAGTFAVQSVEGAGALLTSSQLIDDIVGVEDAAESAGGGLARMGAVVRSTASGSSATAGDNATVNVDTLGRLWTRPGNPCEDHARITTAAISTASSGNVEIVALNGSDLIYVCGYSVVATAATAVQLIYGTGTACATGETNLTGPWSFAANGGITNANGGAPQFVVPAGNAFCIENSGANAIEGHVTYVRTAAP